MLVICDMLVLDVLQSLRCLGQGFPIKFVTKLKSPTTIKNSNNKNVEYKKKLKYIGTPDPKKAKYDVSAHRSISALSISYPQQGHTSAFELPFSLATLTA